MAPFIFIVVGMMTLVFTLFPIKATVWLEERLLVTFYIFFIFCLFDFIFFGGIFVFGERWLTFHVGMVYLYMGLMIESVTL